MKNWALNNLNFIFSILRFIKPILALKEFALVTRYEDIQEVLSRDEAFNVTYAEKMTAITDGGNFFLGMPPGPTYQRDKSNTSIAIRRSDIEDIIIPQIKSYCRDIVDSKTDGQIDFVKDLSSVVPARLMANYIGVPGPSEETLIGWTTHMFHYLFFPNLSEDENQQALKDAAETRQYLDQLLEQRQQSADKKDDAIGRFLAMQSIDLPGTTNTDIRNNLLGIIIGAIPTTSKAATLVLEYFLDHPHIMSAAKRAAEADDIEQLNRYVLEALRFNPFGAGLFRECIQDYRIARGTWRAKTIKKGTSVLIATQSGMMDGRKIKRPKTFNIDRPLSDYMHYGYGLHSCFGRYINYVQIALILQAVLLKDNLRRLHTATEVEYDGPFPSSFALAFDQERNLNMHVFS